MYDKSKSKTYLEKNIHYLTLLTESFLHSCNIHEWDHITTPYYSIAELYNLPNENFLQVKAIKEGQIKINYM